MSSTEHVESDPYKHGEFQRLLDSDRSNLLDAYELNSFSKTVEEFLSSHAKVHKRLQRSTSLSKALVRKCKISKLCFTFGKLSCANKP